MILISRRKTSPGTLPIRKAVNKVTCSCTRPDGSSGGGLERQVALRSGPSFRAGACPAGVRNPVCFLQVGDLVQGWDCARSLASLFPSLLLFFWGTPRTSALSSSSFSPKWRVPFLHLVSSGSPPMPAAAGPALQSQ